MTNHSVLPTQAMDVSLIIRVWWGSRGRHVVIHTDQPSLGHAISSHIKDFLLDQIWGRYLGIPIARRTSSDSFLRALVVTTQVALWAKSIIIANVSGISRYFLGTRGANLINYIFISIQP